MNPKAGNGDVVLRGTVNELWRVSQSASRRRVFPKKFGFDPAGVGTDQGTYFDFPITSVLAGSVQVTNNTDGDVTLQLGP